MTLTRTVTQSTNTVIINTGKSSDDLLKWGVALRLGLGVSVWVCAWRLGVRHVY